LIKFNQEFLNDEKYNVIFMDLMLPGISGQQVLREIRKLEKNLGVENEEMLKL